MDDPRWPPPATDAVVAPPTPWRRSDDGAILGGVARDLGIRTGVDPLWFRIAFVVLTVFSGLGALLYAGSWLILRGRRRGSFGPLVLAGVAVIVVSIVLLLGEGGTDYIDSPWTLVFVLAGVAVALWQPRTTYPPRPAAALPQPGTATPAPTAAPAPRPEPDYVAAVHEPRPPSVLGRWTLALALLVGAAGAIAYEIADDGLHPERWLGAAAVVCGIGIVVGAWRGRALWLVVPALVFAGAGFVAGHSARAGIDDLAAGTREFFVAPRERFGPHALPAREDLVVGDIEVTLYSAPPTDTDLRVGIGAIDLIVDDDVTVDVRAHVHDGDIVVDGDELANHGDVRTIRIGDGDAADAVISATISIGRLEITQRPLPGAGPFGD